MSQIITDKKGYPLEEFDIIKVFHFIGMRRKKHYMYKQIGLYNNKLVAFHLGKLSPTESKFYFLTHSKNDIVKLEDTEIVDGSYPSFENRKKIK